MILKKGFTVHETVLRHFAQVYFFSTVYASTYFSFLWVGAHPVLLNPPGLLRQVVDRVGQVVVPITKQAN